MGVNGGRRNRSSSERRCPSGTSRSLSSWARNSGPAARASRLWTRRVARSRTVATSRTSTLWPGSRIRRASNCRWAARNNTDEATSSAQACRYNQAVKANRPGWAEKSRYP